MLVFTNSDATANRLVRLEMAEEVVAWSDPLHMGMVLPHWDLGAFAATRAVVYKRFGWDEDRVAEQDLRLRNESLQRSVSEETAILLVFGPGLRDQLQLSQILAWLSTHVPDLLGRLQVVLSERHLEEFNSEQLAELMAGSRSVEAFELEDYRAAWLAFVSPDPRFLENALAKIKQPKRSSHLVAALGRLLQEYPSTETGLSLAEGQVVDAVRLGMEKPKELYRVYTETEEFPFLSDWDFWVYLDRLAREKDPLLEVESGERFLCPPKDLAWEAFHSQRLTLTESGRLALSGERIWQPREPRWMGGVCLSPENRWYWDYRAKSLTREASLGALQPGRV